MFPVLLILYAMSRLIMIEHHLFCSLPLIFKLMRAVCWLPYQMQVICYKPSLLLSPIRSTNYFSFHCTRPISAPMLLFIMFSALQFSLSFYLPTSTTFQGLYNSHYSYKNYLIRITHSSYLDPNCDLFIILIFVLIGHFT